MLKQVEIDASKIQRVKTSRSLMSEIEKSKRDEYKTKQMKNVGRKSMRVETRILKIELNKIRYSRNKTTIWKNKKK